MAGLVAGCDSGDASLAPNGTPGAIEAQFFSNSAGFGQAARLVISDQMTWEELWDDFDGNLASIGGQPPGPPAVDFRKSIVVVVAMGQRPTGGGQPWLAS